jgi:drug/metabolite transporter (DMT)-like permease
MNATLFGLFPVIVWGIAVPVFRLVQQEIGLFATSALFLGTAILSILNQYARLKKFPTRKMLRNPILYGRWLFFVMHEGLFFIGVSMVQKEHVPFVILINYLWPTAVILCSVLIAGVKVTRWWAFITGSLVVIASLALEIVGPQGLSAELFANRTECIGYAIIFIGAIAWGLYSALSRRGGDAAGGSTVTPLFQLTVAVILVVAFLPTMDATLQHLTPVNVALMFCYSFTQFVAYLLWDYVVRHGSIVILSLMSDFIPWLSLLTTNVILGVDIGQKTVLSAVSLVAGAMITRYGTLAKKPGKIKPDSAAGRVD